jgi:hypothetical protein
MTVAVELGILPVFSSQPTAEQMMKSLPEALTVAASTPGSIAPARPGTSAAALAARPSSGCGSSSEAWGLARYLAMRCLLPLLPLL